MYVYVWAEREARDWRRYTDLGHVEPLLSAVHGVSRVAHLVLRVPRVPVRTQA